MALYALENIGDAIEATKSFLLPFDRSLWLRLALVVFFVGGGAGLNVPSNGAQFAGDGGFGGPGGPGEPGAPGDPFAGGPPVSDVLLIVAAVVVALVLLGLLFGFVGSVMEFVFVRSLSDREVHVRRGFSRNLGNGLRLFAFRIGVFLLTVGVFVLVGAALLFGVAGGPGGLGPASAVGLFFLLLPILLVLIVLVGLVNGFTTLFVVPIMLLEGRGVLSGWARFWPTLSGQLVQYLVYAVMGFVLGIGTGIVSAFAVGIGALVLAIPFLIVGFVVFFAAGGSFSLPVIVVLAVLAVVYVLLILAWGAVVKVPLQSFLRYYALLVLGDTNEEFDIVPEVRASVRDGDDGDDKDDDSDGSGGTSDGNGGPGDGPADDESGGRDRQSVADDPVTEDRDDDWSTSGGPGVA